MGLLVSSSLDHRVTENQAAPVYSTPKAIRLHVAGPPEPEGITADQPETLYLGGMTVHGNVVSSGGGNPASHRNFPIKDDTIDGNLIVQGWDGFWLGVIRVNVGGNVIFANNSGTQVGLPGTEFEGILDSNEIVSNVIGGNLICHGNTPPAQIGDAILDEGNGPNTVGGNAIGECAPITE
jgi:hypothetical protein